MVYHASPCFTKVFHVLPWLTSNQMARFLRISRHLGHPAVGLTSAATRCFLASGWTSPKAKHPGLMRIHHFHPRNWCSILKIANFWSNLMFKQSPVYSMVSHIPHSEIPFRNPILVFQKPHAKSPHLGISPSQEAFPSKSSKFPPGPTQPPVAPALSLWAPRHGAAAPCSRWSPEIPRVPRVPRDTGWGSPSNVCWFNHEKTLINYRYIMLYLPWTKFYSATDKATERYLGGPSCMNGYYIKFIWYKYINI